MNIILISQHERVVTWYWDPTGGSGKSFLSDWLEVWRNAFVVTGGAYKDIAYRYNYQSYVVFDYARDQQDRFPYQLLEDWKNRRVHSDKYESTEKRPPKCKIIVFTNFEPDKSKLSADRWDIHKLEEPAPLFRAFNGQH